MGARDLLFSITVKSGPGAHPASSAMGTVFLSRGVKRPGRDVTTHPAIAPRLRMGRVIDLLFLCPHGSLWLPLPFFYLLRDLRGIDPALVEYYSGNCLGNYGQLKTQTNKINLEMVDVPTEIKNEYLNGHKSRSLALHHSAR